MSSKKLDIEEFDDFDSIVALCKSEPNQYWKDRDLSSESTGRGDWCDTATIEEAYERLTYGWPAGIENMAAAMKLDNYVPEGASARPKRVRGIVGCAPIVPRAMRGLPDSMVRMAPTRVHDKCFKVFYSASAPCGMDGPELQRAGGIFLRAVEVAESLGYSVEIKVGEVCEMGGAKLSWCVEVKGFHERLDLSRLAFPLSSSSFLRRIDFAVKERSKKTPCHDSGYGRAISKMDEEAKASGFSCGISTYEIIDSNLAVEDVLKRFGVL